MTRIYLWAAVAAVVAGGLLWLRVDAVQDERQRREALDRKHQIETHERIQDAIADPRTPAVIRDRLRALAE